MALFQFGWKVDVVKEYSLEEIPVFSALTAAEKRLVEKKARLLEFKRGDIVYREQTASEAFYVVISGRFRLFTEAKGNFSEETLHFFYRGDHFGETSLLTGKPHSASVEAKSDGLILKLDRDDFLNLVRNVPNISLHLNRSLGHRLTRADETQGHREVKTVALYATSGSPAALQCWMDLAARLFLVTKRKVVFVDFVSPQPPLIQEEFKKGLSPDFDLASLDPSNDANLKMTLIEHPSGFQYLHVKMKGEDGEEKKIKSLITFLTYRFNYLLLRLPSEVQHVSFRVLSKSDMVYIYCEPELWCLEECAQALTEFQQGFGFSKAELRIIIPEEKKSRVISYDKKEEMLGMRIFSVLPDRLNRERYEASMKYLAKELAGNLIGLVLGSGAAHGLAHIGVLKVLEREGVEVDVLAGSSIGALIGALWAGGYSAADIEKIARSINKRNGFFKLIGFRDLSMPYKGFIKGNQINRFCRGYLGEKTFQDLKIPVKIVATDMFTSEEVVFESGSVVDAIQASISIPGVFRPVWYRGRHLIDGGVIDPLPVQVLAKMGVKKIIAVNVLPGVKENRELHRFQKENTRRWLEAGSKKNMWSRLVTRKLHKISKNYALSAVNVIMNTIQFMEYELASSWGKQADILIHPVAHDAHWIEFYTPEKFIETGAAKTEEQIEEIKRLIAE